MKKTIITALALASLAATPAFAQTYRPANDGGPMASNSPPTSSRSMRTDTRHGYGAYAAAPDEMVGGPAVYAYGRYAGWDPDPFIRLQLRRGPVGGD